MSSSAHGGQGTPLSKPRGDLTDGIRRAGGCHARSPAAPAGAEPGRAGSPVTVRLMTIGMGCRRSRSGGGKWIASSPSLTTCSRLGVGDCSRASVVRRTSPGSSCGAAGVCGDAAGGGAGAGAGTWGARHVRQGGGVPAGLPTLRVLGRRRAWWACAPTGPASGPARPLQGPAVPRPGLCSRRGKEADWPRPAGRLFRLIAGSGLGGPVMIVS